MTYWFKRIHIFFIDHLDLPLQDRKDIGNSLLEFSLSTPMEALFMFNMVVGDTVVIWRAWVLYTDQLWLLGIPCLMLTMSLVFAIIDLTCLTGAGITDQSSIASGGAICQHSELISWAFSLVTNASCTVLIGIKAWEHRRSMLLMTGESRRTVSERVLSLLVESGFIYCLFWLTQLILFFDIDRNSPVYYLYIILSGMGDQISGMYPTLIVVIVNFQQTIWQEKSVAGSSGIGTWKVSDRSAVFGSRSVLTGSQSGTMAGHSGNTGHEIYLESQKERQSPDDSIALAEMTKSHSFDRDNINI
ncbi:hypothetical protein C8J56DRAFT_802355 [Mycena floridula]|nr:hypothetical protein C8J56DRAFT_802355 [Mycena floridula]